MGDFPNAKPPKFESGWLIEIASPDDGRPLWWQGGGTWNTDASYAIRFARKCDAEAILKFTYVPRFYGPGSEPIAPIATEHCW